MSNENVRFFFLHTDALKSGVYFIHSTWHCVVATPQVLITHLAQIKSQETMNSILLTS